MPITLPPITRRRFLAGAVAASAAPLVGRTQRALAADPSVAHFALMADTHIAADRQQVLRGTNMAANLEHVVQEIAQQEAIEAALVNGDCAVTRGETADYETLIQLFEPLRAAGRPVHMTLGNHDHRERFLAAVPGKIREPSGLEGRYATIVESPLANWFLLDTLDVTNQTPGRLGEAQLEWLARELDARAQRPAIVLTHHHPSRAGAISGLVDTPALMEVLVPRGQVKALVFGHTHHWRVREEEGLHLVNLPPVAYPFVPTDPSGWVLATLRREGARLRLNSIDQDHEAHAQEVDLAWRRT